MASALSLRAHSNAARAGENWARRGGGASESPTTTGHWHGRGGRRWRGEDEAARWPWWRRRAAGGEEGAVEGGGGRGAAAARPGARPPGVELHSIQRPPAAHRQVLPPPLGQQAPAGPQDVRDARPSPSLVFIVFVENFFFLKRNFVENFVGAVALLRSCICV